MAHARVGRPRSEKSQEAILSAIRDLLSERGGAGLTIEGIARRAGVGKPTIYRWWPSLADIVLDVLLRQADTQIVVPSRLSLRATLRRFLRQSVKAIVDGAGVHLRFLMAQAQQDEAFRQRFRDHFTERRRAVLKSIFVQAQKRGEIGSAHDVELLTDVVFGTLWYRLLIGHASMDEALADDLTEVILALVAPASPDTSEEAPRTP